MVGTKGRVVTRTIWQLLAVIIVVFVIGVFARCRAMHNVEETAIPVVEKIGE